MNLLLACTPRDTANLIRVLKELRDLGNTVVVVEHDEMMMREADHIIDMGPIGFAPGWRSDGAGNYNEIISNEGKPDRQIPERRTNH
jgi:excinuclease ABC subunit A